MAYTQQTWTDGVTSANKTRFDVIEKGIADAHALAEAIVSLARAPAGSRFSAPLNGTLNTSATTARPSTRPEIHFMWYSTVQPNNMLPGDTWEAPNP